MAKTIDTKYTTFSVQENNLSNESNRIHNFLFLFTLYFPTSDYTLFDVVYIIKVFSDLENIGMIEFINERNPEDNFSARYSDPKIDEIKFIDFRKSTPSIGIVVNGFYFNIGSRNYCKSSKVYPDKFYFPTLVGKLPKNKEKALQKIFKKVTEKKKVLHTLSDFLENNNKEKQKETLSEEEVNTKMETLKVFFKKKYKISKNPNEKGNYFLERKM